MFYSVQILSKGGPLQVIWMAAHMDRNLKRQQVDGTNIAQSVDTIMHPSQQASLSQDGGLIQLRLTGQLLLGVVRVFKHQITYLQQDCEAALSTMLVFRKQAQIAGQAGADKSSNPQDPATAIAAADTSVTPIHRINPGATGADEVTQMYQTDGWMDEEDEVFGVVRGGGQGGAGGIQLARSLAPSLTNLLGTKSPALASSPWMVAQEDESEEEMFEHIPERFDFDLHDDELAALTGDAVRTSPAFTSDRGAAAAVAKNAAEAAAAAAAGGAAGAVGAAPSGRAEPEGGQVPKLGFGGECDPFEMKEEDDSSEAKEFGTATGLLDDEEDQQEGPATQPQPQQAAEGGAAHGRDADRQGGTSANTQDYHAAQDADNAEAEAVSGREGQTAGMEGDASAPAWHATKEKKTDDQMPQPEVLQSHSTGRQKHQKAAQEATCAAAAAAAAAGAAAAADCEDGQQELVAANALGSLGIHKHSRHRAGFVDAAGCTLENRGIRALQNNRMPLMERHRGVHALQSNVRSMRTWLKLTYDRRASQVAGGASLSSLAAEYTATAKASAVTLAPTLGGRHRVVLNAGLQGLAPELQSWAEETMKHKGLSGGKGQGRGQTDSQRAATAMRAEDAALLNLLNSMSLVPSTALCPQLASLYVEVQRRVSAAVEISASEGVPEDNQAGGQGAPKKLAKSRRAAKAAAAAPSTAPKAPGPDEGGQEDNLAEEGEAAVGAELARVPGSGEEADAVGNVLEEESGGPPEGADKAEFDSDDPDRPEEIAELTGDAEDVYLGRSVDVFEEARMARLEDEEDLLEGVGAGKQGSDREVDGITTRTRLMLSQLHAFLTPQGQTNKRRRLGEDGKGQASYLDGPLKEVSFQKHLLPERVSQAGGGQGAPRSQEAASALPLARDSRINAARAFYDVLVLKNRGFVDVRQQRPFSDFVITSRPKLAQL